MGAYTFNFTASFASGEDAGATLFLSRLAETIAQLSNSAPSAAPANAVAAIPAPRIETAPAPAIAAPIAAPIAQPEATVTEEAPASSETAPKRRGRPAGSTNKPKATDTALPQPATPGATTAPTAPATPVATPATAPAEETSSNPFDLGGNDDDAEAAAPPVPNKVTLDMVVKLANVAFKSCKAKYVEFIRDNKFRSATELKPEQYSEIYAKLLALINSEISAGRVSPEVIANL